MSIFSRFTRKEENKSIEEPFKPAFVRDAATSSSTEEAETISPVVINNPDPYFTEAARLVLEKEKASIGMLQRWFKIGFNRAARIMDQLAEAGIVGSEEGTKPRELLISLDEFERNTSVGVYEFSNVRETPREEYDPIVSQNMLEEMIRSRVKREPEFHPENAQKLLDAGNIFIPKSDYDLPLDIVEKIISGCHPNDMKLVLVDSMGVFNLYNGLPNLFIPVVNDTKKAGGVINWAIAEMEHRKNDFVESGKRDYAGYLSSTDKKPPVITILIRELYDLLQNVEVFETLKTLLPACTRFGISVIAFSMYDTQFLQLRELNSFFNTHTLEWGRSFLEGTISEQQTDTDEMDAMTGIEFERFCANILGRSGFSDISMTKKSGDYGGDILATKDQIRYVIQCKRYDSNIGVHAVQEVIASRSIYKAHVGVVMTNMHYTDPAKTLAHENNIILWDREDILRMASVQKEEEDYGI